MKNIFLLLFLLTVFTTIAQTSSLETKDSLTVNGSLELNPSLIESWKTTESIGIIKNTFIESDKFILFNKDITEVFKMDRKGDFYFTPKYYCDCRKCKKHKGMKKLIINLSNE